MWNRVEDNFCQHPKVLAAGHEAAWLDVCAINYAGRLLTDGYIPAEIVGQLWGFSTRKLGKLVERLVAVGLWEVADGGFLIHDFLIYNPSRDKVLAKRAAAVDRMQRVRSRELPANFATPAAPPPTRPDDEYVPDRLPPDTGGRVAETVRANGAAGGGHPAATAAAPRRSNGEGRSWRTDPETLGRLGALGRAFGERGQDLPNVGSYAEHRALDALLRAWPAEDLAQCWADIRSGRYGDDFDRRELSWNRLNARRRVANWHDWQAGRTGLAASPRRRDGYDARAL